MAEEFELELEDSEEKKNTDRALIRNKDLSDKLKVKDEALTKAETEKASALKEAEFYKGFNPLASKYQGAAEFQDKIKEKVMAGYDVEDATISILAKEGKYQPQEAPEPVRESPAGGSAVNQIKSENKGLSEMSREEKRAKLMENESEMIDLLSPKIRM